MQDVRLRFQRLRDYIDDYLWKQNLSTLPYWSRLLVRTIQILFAVIRDLTLGQLSLRAMSLVFTTLIGILPLLALTFSVLKGLGVHNALEPTLLTLLEPLGGRSQEVTSQILQFVDELQVELIGITSMGLLLYIVLDMMRKIEMSFNFIWTVKVGRSWSSRVSEYLFAVIVSPLLLFLSISITSYVNTNYFENFLANLLYGGMILGALAFITPILLMSLAFAFAYSFLPNTKVQFSSAFIGGLVTTIIWKLMGSMFQALFVSSARESIYLAFATAIAVMFFVYFGWLVALIGSSISFYHQYPAKARTGREQIRLSISQRETLTLTLATTVLRRFHQGEAALDIDELAAELRLSPAAIEPAIDSLLAIGLISCTADDPPKYLPSKSIHDCRIVDIWKLIRHQHEDAIVTHQQSEDLQIIKQFEAQIDAVVEREMGARRFVDEIAGSRRIASSAATPAAESSTAGATDQQTRGTSNDDDRAAAAKTDLQDVTENSDSILSAIAEKSMP